MLILVLLVKVTIEKVRLIIVFVQMGSLKLEPKIVEIVILDVILAILSLEIVIVVSEQIELKLQIVVVLFKNSMMIMSVMTVSRVIISV